ncbi:ABC transporter substrate-binding protein [Bordetella genomosp. 10]|uniref:ABC transporter substrate-binding protein n=1 Tax=Bordetella genomosp. 10 TaxID=1416804 RepID=A0A261SNF9_9BORD|nr:tripartite tricarboxylate transporter substrate binding protein [Bordetella genomosp. 10]OZI37863.1 ABC transporter substrate-binding protein [Bordetella genomosp. 10]
MKLKHCLASLCVAACGLLSLQGHAAEPAYPSRPIVLVVPFPPGGITDLTARTFAKYMGEQLGGSIIVENKPGAGAMIGANYVAKAAPDGYTLLLGTNVTHAISPQLMPQVHYDPLTDFAPIGIFGKNGNVLIVPPASPVHNFQEFIAYLKDKKGQAIGASPSVGSSSHLAAELLKQKVPGLSYLHVPYNGPSASMSAVIGRQVDFMFTNIGAAVSQIQAGSVRAIAVTTAERVPQLPDVPTVIESGIPGFDIVGWFAAFAPKGTPPQIVQRLNDALNAAQANPELRKVLDAATLERVDATPEQTADFVKSEYRKWGDIIRNGHITVN